MKTLLTTLFLIVCLSGTSQITRVTGQTTADTTQVFTKSTDSDLKLGYVANSSKIQEFSDYELVDVLTVEEVTFFTDKIFYRVKNSAGLVFGITFTIADRTVFFADASGNFTEIYGEGLTFAHQY